MVRLVVLLTTLLQLTGCMWHGACTKRAQEECCPTDIRQMHRWCWGEDAVFDTPCGPDEAYHGYKPTCWRPWDAPATVWRDERCGAPPLDYSTTPPPAARVTAPLPSNVILSPLEPSPADPTAVPGEQEYIEEPLPGLNGEDPFDEVPQAPVPGPPGIGDDVEEALPPEDAATGMRWPQLTQGGAPAARVDDLAGELAQSQVVMTRRLPPVHGK